MDKRQDSEHTDTGQSLTNVDVTKNFILFPCIFFFFLMISIVSWIIVQFHAHLTAGELQVLLEELELQVLLEKRIALGIKGSITCRTPASLYLTNLTLTVPMDVVVGHKVAYSESFEH